MYPITTSITLTALALLSSDEKKAEQRGSETTRTIDIKVDSMYLRQGHMEVNGLNMYYEIYGEGKPLVLIHGGGSTIQTTFGRVIPLLAKNRKIIAMELQAHGRTTDRDAELSFEQDALDVVTLLKRLNIDKADFLGFSNGGTTALFIAQHYPNLVNKIILASALAKREGVPKWFWDFMENAKLQNMPQQLKDAYLKVTPDVTLLQTMHDKDARRMLNFMDIPDEKIQHIKAPTLVLVGDKDVITLEHAMELHQLLTNSELAVIPGGHGEYIGEVTTLKPDFKETDLVIPLLEKFLDKAW